MSPDPNQNPPPRPIWRRARPAFFVFCALALAGLFLLLSCPPLWRDYDGLIQISNRPNDMTLLQYPPAYPFFSRFHIFAAEIIGGWIHHTKTVINIRKAVTLNDAGLCALIISQQVALALALTYFAQICARGWKARLLIVVLLLSNASVFIPAQLISTEALSQSLLILFIALGFHLFRSERLSGWSCGAYALCLFGLIMTRHANAVFAMLLPLAYLLIGLLQRLRGSSVGGRPWKLAALFIALGFASIEASDLSTRLLCRVFDVEFRDISARGTSEKLGFVDEMTPPEREAFLAKLQTQTNDPVVKEAIPLLARHASWDKQREEIVAILRRESPQAEEQKLRVVADSYLEKVAGLFYATHNHYLLGDMTRDTWRAVAQTTAGDVAQYFLHTAAWSLDLYPTQPALDKRTHGLASCSPEARARIVALEENPWLRLWNWTPHGAILLVTSLATIFLLVRRTGEPSGLIYALATTVVSVVATILTFYFVNFQPRFTSIAGLLAFLSLGFVIGSLSKSPVQPGATS